MSNQTNDAQAAAEASEPKMTAADAAKLVKRLVPVLDDKKKVVTNEKTGEIKTKPVAIKEEEILNFADYGDHVVVVTTNGEKLRGDKK
jgi:hypothetical protein